MTSPARTRWAAVVVNFESGRRLLTCVESLLADTSAGVPEVVVVDNGSSDGSADLVRRAHPSRALRAWGCAAHDPDAAVRRAAAEVSPRLATRCGDLSELALGWCTYGVGDQMSHYAVNASVPKSLIQYLVQ